MMKHFYPWGLYQCQLMIVGTHLQPKYGMDSLACNMAGVSSASSSHIAIHSTAAKIQLPVCKTLLLETLTLNCSSQMDFKATDNNGKDLLTIRKDQSKDSLWPFSEKSISKAIKGPKRT